MGEMPATFSSGGSTSSHDNPQRRTAPVSQPEVPHAQLVGLQREVARLKKERDSALNEARTWQVQVAALKAQLDKERGSHDRKAHSAMVDHEKDIRSEIEAEWSKSESSWRERIRNERLLRLSYERVLLNLGFAPNRIASDLVRVSRVQPLHDDRNEADAFSLLDVEQRMISEPACKRRGLFSYTIEDLKREGGLTSATPLPPLKSLPKEDDDVAPRLQSGFGRRELLRSLGGSSSS